MLNIDTFVYKYILLRDSNAAVGTGHKQRLLTSIFYYDG